MVLARLFSVDSQFVGETWNEDSRLVSRRDCRRRKIIGNRFPEESADHEETRRRLLRDCFRLLFEWQTHSVRNNGSRTRWDGFVGGRYVSGGRGFREGVVICIIPRLLVSRGSRVHGLQLLQQIRGITLCVTLSAGTFDRHTISPLNEL